MIDKRIIECNPHEKKSRGNKSGIDMIQCGYVKKKGQKITTADPIREVSAVLGVSA